MSSILSVVSWNIESLIIFRLIQGFSAGLIIPLLTTLLLRPRVIIISGKKIQYFEFLEGI